MVALVWLFAVVGGTYWRTQSWPLAGAAGALCFVGSAFLHPYVRCGACKGSGRHRGGVFSYAWPPCHVCNGAGWKQRVTALVLGLGERTTSASWIAPTTRSFGSRK
jgi:hypothetical protein